MPPKRTLPTGIHHSGRKYRWVIHRGYAPDGKRLTDGKSGYATVREAELARAARLVEIEHGVNTAPSRDTVAGWLDTWLAAHARAVTGNTIRTYRNWVRWCIAPHLGTVLLRDLSVLRVQRWHADLLAGVPRTIGGNVVTRALHPRTVMSAHTLLVMALDGALLDGQVARNVAKLAGGVHVPDSDETVWSEAEIKRFLDGARGDGLYALWHLALWTGMRSGELLALRWEDVDLAQGIVHVRRGKTFDAEHRVIVAGPKRGSIRDVTLDGECVAVLKLHHTEQKKQRLRAGRWWVEGGLVFANPTGGLRESSALRHHLRRLCARIGVPVITVHQLRHAHGAWLSAAGVPQRDIAQRLGHKHLRTTERYMRPMQGQQRVAVERLRQRLDALETESVERPVAKS